MPQYITDLPEHNRRPSERLTTSFSRPLLFAAIALVLASGSMIVSRTPLDGFIWSALSWFGLTLLCWLIIVSNLAHLRRAAKFHLLFGGMFWLASLPLFDASFRIAWPNFSFAGPLVVALMVVGFLLALMLWAYVMMWRLQQSTQYNIQAGRLSLARAEWDLQVPLFLGEPAQQEAHRKWWSKATPVLMALSAGLIAAIDALTHPQFTASSWSILEYSFALICVLASTGNQAGIGIQLLKWERSLGKHILLTNVQR